MKTRPSWKTPKANTGEPTIGQWIVRQWKHMIEHMSDWSILVDGAGEDYARHVLTFLDDPKPDARVVACELLGAIGYIGASKFGLGQLAPTTLERFRALAATDRDARVRGVATKRADELAESIEMYAVRAEFPWLTDYSASSLDDALLALDDSRAAVRSHVVSWWMFAWDVPTPIGTKAEAKLVALLASADDDERSSIELALDHVRHKMSEKAQ